MSIRIKQLAIRLLLKLLRTTRNVFRALWSLLTILLSPLTIVLKFTFKPIALQIYRWYLAVATRLKRSAFMQNRILFLFGNKYFIHVIIVVIAVFVTSTNILEAQARTSENYASESALFGIVNPDGVLGDDIVEQGLLTTTATGSTYYDTSGMLVANIPELDPNGQPLRTIGEELAQIETKSGTALISNNALETSSGTRADFIEYKVRNGDSVGSISDRFGLTASSILWANGLGSNDYIQPGDTLSIPYTTGYTVTIEDGDTLEKLVDKHEGDLEETIRLIGGETAPVGQKVVIVDGYPYTPPPPPTPTYTASTTSSNPYQANRTVAPIASTGDLANYPVGCGTRGTTYWGHGLAGDYACPSGTPVYAVHDGNVSVGCSGGYCGGYGNYLRVSGGGYSSLYAHMSAFNVTSGYVSRGQVIGFVGSTGRSTGPHLHLEFWASGVKQNPFSYWP